ncbi:MAG: hypothetical protein K2O45_12395 [Oscillospiraceae bacterium]|nr:hypothetical protein [Oscillospiraceae bacterium]
MTFTYALIPPVTLTGGGGGGTTIPDGPTPLVPDLGMTIADQDVPLVAPGLNNPDHFDYIKGYVIDGQILVRPEANITRAEDGVTGIRTALLPEQDWAALEKEWAAADANVADVTPKLGTEGEKLEEEAKEPETTGGDDGNGEE